jgi:DNA-binding NtrC family response regulator
MDNLLPAILIHERPYLFDALKGVLCDISVESYSVDGWDEAKAIIAEYQPLVVFVDLFNWNRWQAEIVKMANAADHTFNVIVVGPLPDIELHASVREQGAFSFVAPPFSHEALTMAVHSAVMDVRDRRESLALVGAHPLG